MRTLRNAVERDQVHHAYLFVGSRGTGKTSMAKILAACLNCERGGGSPTTEPCGECESCVSIAHATSLDVIEMDAASNNSVDDIRELRESVAYAPVSGRRKVYILDEAHMLSPAAWNAFLKTLEEPPPSTVFVLATTEAGKVPATVVDRCHRFDFQRPGVEQIASVVRRAAAAESIEIPPAAVAALARFATGSFRDALGTLEQLLAYSGSPIALEDVLAVLGVADASLIEATIDAVAHEDAAGALRALEQCAEQGRDAGSFASDLERRARELLVVQVLEELPSEFSLTPEADAALVAQAARIDHAAVVRLLELLGEAMESVRAGADARTRLELALVKAARPQADGSMRALLARIERLEHARAGGQEGAPPAPAPAPAPKPAQRDSAELAADAPGAAAPAVDPPVMDPPAMDPPAMDPPAMDPPAMDPPAMDPPAMDPPAMDAPTTDPPAMDPPAMDPPARGDLESITASWPAVVELVRAENAMLWACLAEARPVAVDGEELTLAYPPDAEFHKKKAEGAAHRVAIAEALKAVTGLRWQLAYELRDELARERDTQAGERSEEEWVARFMQEFGAQELPADEAVTSNEKAP